MDVLGVRGRRGRRPGGRADGQSRDPADRHRAGPTRVGVDGVVTATEPADDDDRPPPRPDRRALGPAIAALGALSKSWMDNPDVYGVRGVTGEIRVGPLGFEECAGACRELSNGELVELIAASYPLDKGDYTSGAFAPAGWVALIASVIAALGL